jgi:hypothetical protein
VTENISKLKRKETSTYKPSDLWTQQDDLLFLKYCPTKQERLYHAMPGVIGPRFDLAEDLIPRFKGLFTTKINLSHDRTQSASTVAFLNGVRVEAFPSHHVDTMRGLTDVKWILSDESDMYPPFQQKKVRAVMEGYIGKPNSNPTIVLVSTSKAPGGLMQQIEIEPDSLYHKLFFDYHYGLQGPYPVYSEEQIQKARLSPGFGREYELRYLFVGNVFSQASIVNCHKLEYNPENIHQNVKKSLATLTRHMVPVTSLSVQLSM